MAAKKQIDWEAIEREYRAGQLSIREIARQHGISNPAIIKKAKKEGWDRDLTEPIRQKVSAKLVSSEVSDKVSTINTREVIEAAAQRGVEVVRSHRKYLRRLLDIADRYMADLEADSEKPFEEKLSAREQADMLRALGQVMAKAIPLERQAFNLNEQENAGEIVITTKPARGIDETNL